jgi:amidase
MAKNVIDASILLSAMKGEDPNDPITKGNSLASEAKVTFTKKTFEMLRFGVNKQFLSDSLYKIATLKIKSLGGTLVEFEPESVRLGNFGKVLDADMKIDLKNYLTRFGKSDLLPKSIDDVIRHNSADSLFRMPYSQGRLDGVYASEMSADSLAFYKEGLKKRGVAFFETPMRKHNLDVVLSINNWNAGHAAVAQYPCLTLSMGYSEKGAPKGLTFIARPFEEEKLLEIAALYEQETLLRRLPNGY